MASLPLPPELGQQLPSVLILHIHYLCRQLISIVLVSLRQYFIVYPSCLELTM